MDLDRVEADALAATWAAIPEHLDAKEFADRLAEILNDVCDSAMPRSSLIGRNHQPMYWWNNEIAELRATCVRVRRRL